MFSLIRLVIFSLVAFAAGVFFERANETSRCTTAGGERTAEGICIKASTHG